jgi:hypothetical protein
MEEKIFYQNGSISVTQSRFIVENKTYAVRNISSVQIGVITASWRPGLIIIFIGAIFAWSQENLLIGLIIIIIGGLYIYFLKNKYSVRISTNAGSTDGLISTNEQYIAEIVDALNEAIIHTGVNY